MKNWMLCGAMVVGLLVAGCHSKQGDERIAKLEADAMTAREAQSAAESKNNELAALLKDAEAERDELRNTVETLRASSKGDDKPTEAKSNDQSDEIAELKAQLTEKDKEIADLKAKLADVPPADMEKNPDPLETEGPIPDTPTAEELAEAKQKLDDLLPLVKGGDTKSLGDMTDLLVGVDKTTRDEYISKVQKWVEDEPTNKHARIALASALSTRFQDLTNPMKMGALAGDIKKETEEALKIDPEYYEAQHFLAILSVNYPTFTQEFKDANTALDKALELQADMTWEDRFADIYVHYSMWHRKQGQLDEAASWVQKGMDYAPRHEGLLNEQANVEGAQAEGTEE